MQSEKTILAMPVKLFTGYLAIIFFMTGDGFDLAFLSQYLVELGFSSTQASLVFSVYGLTAAVSAWLSGVVAEVIGAKKAMLTGFVMWVTFHALFLTFGVEYKNYYLILCFYGLRGFAYPLFLYSFVVMIVQSVSGTRVSPALGWFWTVYSIGIGVAGAFIPSATIPMIGEKGTLYLALAFAMVGGLIVLFFVKETHARTKTTFAQKLAEIKFSITLFKNKSVLYACIIRIINTMSLFGFAVIMPLMFVQELNFTTSEWLQVWAVFFITTVFTNVLWGVIGEYIGWITVIRYFGCLGMAFSTLLFYYAPHAFAGSLLVCHVCAVLLGIFVACFVQITPILTSLEPEHKGACISVYNLAAGTSNFVAPAIATISLPWVGIQGVVIIYAMFYLLAFGLTFLLKVEHESFAPRNPFKHKLNKHHHEEGATATVRSEQVVRA